MYQKTLCLLLSLMTASAQNLYNNDSTCGNNASSRFAYMHQYLALLAEIANNSSTRYQAERRSANMAVDLLRFDVATVERQLDEWLADCWLRRTLAYRGSDVGRVQQLQVNFFYKSSNDVLNSRARDLFPNPVEDVYLVVYWDEPTDRLRIEEAMQTLGFQNAAKAGYMLASKRNRFDLALPIGRFLRASLWQPSILFTYRWLGGEPRSARRLRMDNNGLLQVAGERSTRLQMRHRPLAANSRRAAIDLCLCDGDVFPFDRTVCIVNLRARWPLAIEEQQQTSNSSSPRVTVSADGPTRETADGEWIPDGVGKVFCHLATHKLESNYATLTMSRLETPTINCVIALAYDRASGKYVTTWLFTCNALVLVAIVGMFVGCRSSERYSLGATIMVPLATFVLQLDSVLLLPTTGSTPLVRQYLLALITNCLVAMLLSNARMRWIPGRAMMQRLTRRQLILACFLLVHAAVNAWAAVRWRLARRGDVDLLPHIWTFLQWGSMPVVVQALGQEELTLDEFSPNWACTIADGCFRT